MQQKQLLTEKDIKSTETVLAKDDRVEIIPAKEGVKIIRVKREERVPILEYFFAQLEKRKE